MHRIAAVALLSLLALLGPSPAAAQGGSKGVVNVSASGPSDAVPAGGTFQVTVTLAVKSGFHINAQKPSEDYLIGTSLKLSPPTGIEVTKVAYPAPRMAKFSFSDAPLAVYEGSVQLVATCKTAASLAPGAQKIPGKVTFQACNDQSCLPPSTVDVSADATVSAAEPSKSSIAITGAPPEARVTVDGAQVGRTDAQGRYTARDVESGRRRVRVEREGFETWDRTVTVDAARPLALAVTMRETDLAAAQGSGAAAAGSGATAAGSGSVVAQPTTTAEQTAPAATTGSGSTTTAQTASEEPPSHTGRNAAVSTGAVVVVLAAAAAARRRRRARERGPLNPA